MKVLNPLEEKIITKVCGVLYEFEPGETKDIFDMNHFNMFKKKKKIGLVVLPYNDPVIKNYATYEDYLHAKKVESLQALLKEAKGHYLNEKQAESEMNSSKEATTVEKDRINVGKFEKRVKEIEGELENLSKKKTKKDK